MFTHLHLHTEFSLLDGMCRIPHLLQRARELGMDALAITDHGALYGIIEFYLQAREAGIKPILGCELYVAPQRHQSREPAEKNPYHLILLTRNERGYRNLIQLTTKAHLEGFYYRPRVDRELLAQHHEGLIALSACPQGEIGRLIVEGRLSEAEKAALWHKEVFSDYYLELLRHEVPELAQINKEILSLSRKLNIPVVATNDVHYVNPADAYAHDVLLCIQTNSTIYDEKRPKMAGDSFYLKSPEEMASLFSDVPEALENTGRVAEMCQLELEFGHPLLPQIETPPGKTADEYLAELCWQGLGGRYPEVTPEVEERLSYELEVIRKTNFADYFLVVWDLISFARERNILFGVRGSAAASIALYCLGVTDIDPLTYDLVFERFLNLERREMPDIDLDFQDDRREEVISYSAQKYGADHVAQIITFGTLGARAALRDVGRALGLPYGDVDRVARLIPPALHITLAEARQSSPELRRIYEEDAAGRHLMETAEKLEGVSRHVSTHAAGVVISKEPLDQLVPLQRPARGEEQGIAMTQFAMEDIARIGLLKMDFLGLANLTILAKAKENIAQTLGKDIDLGQIPLDDRKTFDLLSSGETVGVFQLEGAGMRRYIKELKPTSLGDIAAMVALYRPGPMQHLPTFISAKHGREPIRYPHPLLSQILEETYGVIVYQDQVLRIVQAFAGYSLGEADIVRKAMGKKIPQVMREERKRFIEGARAKGLPVEAAQRVWGLIEPFAGYAFNKAHSVSYAMIAYQTAYLKANYPAEFMAAVLTTNMDQPEKVASAVAECRHLDITVLPPDINKSVETFTVEKEGDRPAIRFGLAAIKNVGASALRPIIAAREKGGPFKSVEDLCRRADLRGINKRMLESLIKAGALDSLEGRGTLLGGVDRLLSLAQQEQRLKETGQSTMFDLWGQAAEVPLARLELPPIEVSPRQKLAWEKELLGVYLSDHPLGLAARRLSAETTALCGQIDESLEGQTVTVAGIVAGARQLFTRERRPFVVATLEDLDGSIEVAVWPEVYERTRNLWGGGNILLVTGKVRRRGERIELSCQSVTPYQVEGIGEEGREFIPPAGEERAIKKEEPPHHLIISIAQTGDAAGDIARLKEVFALLRQYPGGDKVRLAIRESQGTVKLEVPDLTTGYCPELHQRLAALVREEGVTVEGGSGP